MSSKDISLDLVEHLNLLKQNNTDYLLVCLEPGKNADRADVWYELKDKDSPHNLLEACLSLFSEIYDEEELITCLFGFCEALGNAYGQENQDEGVNLPHLKLKKKNKKRDDNDKNS